MDLLSVERGEFLSVALSDAPMDNLLDSLLGCV